jgi:thiamine-monophosphate kinase
MPKLDEADIIAGFKRAFLVPDYVVGIGDDAAVIYQDDGTALLITKDMLLEDVHFRHKYFTADALAHKALHANVSDIAAMGGEPKYLLLGIALPSDVLPDWVQEFTTSFARKCQEFGITLIGGDTTRSHTGIVISITLLGDATKEKIKFRSYAKPGNIIAVTGFLGEAYAGLQDLEHDRQSILCDRQLYPTARLKEGQWFAAQASVTAMMDISDGLALDLPKLIHASQVGATVEASKILLSPALNQSGYDPLSCALSGGEDYELLLTITADAWPELLQRHQQQFTTPLTAIGTITAHGFNINGMPSGLPIQPFTHFGEAKHEI